MLLIGLIALWICPIVVFFAYVCLKKPTGEERLGKEVNMLTISGIVAVVAVSTHTILAVVAVSTRSLVETIDLIGAIALVEMTVWAIIFVIDFVINFIPWTIKKFIYKGIKDDSEPIPAEDIIDTFVFTEDTSDD